MTDRYDPLKTESIPDEPKRRAKEAFSPEVHRTQGRGELFSETERVATVRYGVSIIEETSPKGQVPDPVLTGQGIFTLIEEVQSWDAGDKKLALHLDDGRSFPIHIEEQDAEGGYRFRIRSV